jgi:asparagine N-glycosylation enzyme membrane subunit Stt3
MDILGLLKKHYWIFLLLLILTTAWYIRYIPGTKDVYPEMLEIDSHFFLRMGEYILAHGSLPTHDAMAAWNTIPGGPDRATDYVVTIWAYPFFYYILNPIFGWSLYWVGVWVPAFFGTLHVLIMYFIGKDMFNNRKIGLLAATFLAFSPGILYRVSAGFMEKEPVAGIFLLMSLYFFVLSFKEKGVDKSASWKHLVTHPFSVLDKLKFSDDKIKDIKTIAYGVMAGVMFTITTAASGLVSTMLLMIGGFVVFAAVFNKYSKTLLYAQGSATISFMLLDNLVPTAVGLTSIGLVAMYSALALLVIRFAAERFKIVGEKSLKFVVPVLFIIGVFGMLLSAYINVGPGEWVEDNIQRISNPLTLGVIPSTVAESQPVGSFMADTLASFGNQYAINAYQLPGFLVYFSMIVFSWLGIVLLSYEFIFKKGGIENLLLVVAFLLSMIFAIGAARLAFVFAFPVAITAAYFLIRGGSYVLGGGKKYLKGKGELYIKIAGGVFIGVIISTSFASAWVMGNSITSSFTNDWRQAFDWIRNNTPKDAITLEWWDFGWWFEYYAQRTTLVDGGYHSQTPTQDIAKFYTQPLTDDIGPYSSLNFLKNYSVDYVMVSSDLIPKFGAMSKIANWGEKVDVLPVFNLASNYQDGGKVLLEYGDPASQSIVVAYSTSTSGNSTTLQNITALIKMPQGQAYIKNIGIGDQVISSNRANSIPGLLYFAGSAVIFVPEAVQDCVFVRLYLFNGAGFEKYFEKVYDNLGMKIYRVKYENFSANITGQYINAANR